MFLLPFYWLLWICFCCSFFFPSSLGLSSCSVMTVFSVVFELFFLCLCICCRFLVCSYSEVLIGIYIFIYEIVLSCWSLNCKCISSVLHWYPPVLTISDFGGIIVHGWFFIFTLYIPLLWALSFVEFLFPEAAFSFLPREVPLVFVVILL